MVDQSRQASRSLRATYFGGKSRTGARVGRSGEADAAGHIGHLSRPGRLHDRISMHEEIRRAVFTDPFVALVSSWVGSSLIPQKTLITGSGLGGRPRVGNGLAARTAPGQRPPRESYCLARDAALLAHDHGYTTTRGFIARERNLHQVVRVGWLGTELLLPAATRSDQRRGPRKHHRAWSSPAKMPGAGSFRGPPEHPPEHQD